MPSWWHDCVWGTLEPVEFRLLDKLSNNFLAARAVPGLEELAGSVYRRAVRLPHGPGVAELTAANGHFVAAFRLAHRSDLAPAVARSRRLLHLDADPAARPAGADPSRASDTR